MGFDRYFEKGLQEGTKPGRGEDLQHLFEGDSTEIRYKMAESFLKTNRNKNKLDIYFPLKLFKPRQGHQIMIATNRNT